ncbi:hypothetical protein AUP43_16670 [Oceanibaculum pacificum]|uniref:Uncharacterized protein n=1 Tax=Oceanibaculum pacificum TaxID=580166 RepID=A0A154WFT5_9PROT|nr:hypothetical protein AUP43_16670 [Oceanibaculum pacificum]
MLLCDAQGRPEVEGQTLDGKLDGAVRFYAEGKLAMVATYKTGALDGPMTSYGADGAVLGEALYRDGIKLSESPPALPPSPPLPPAPAPPTLAALLKLWLSAKLAKARA